jgi:hypothetical protein
MRKIRSKLQKMRIKDAGRSYETENFYRNKAVRGYQKPRTASLNLFYYFMK